MKEYIFVETYRETHIYVFMERERRRVQIDMIAWGLGESEEELQEGEDVQRRSESKEREKKRREEEKRRRERALTQLCFYVDVWKAEQLRRGSLRRQTELTKNKTKKEEKTKEDEGEDGQANREMKGSRERRTKEIKFTPPVTSHKQYRQNKDRQLERFKIDREIQGRQINRLKRDGQVSVSLYVYVERERVTEASRPMLGIVESSVPTGDTGKISRRCNRDVWNNKNKNKKKKNHHQKRARCDSDG